MTSSNSDLNESLLFELNIKSLSESLKKIPEFLVKNDYEALYDEIENDINNQIKKYDFEALSLIEGKLKYAHRYNNYNKHAKNLLIDLILNEETKTIIEKENIPVEIIFFLDENLLNKNVPEIKGNFEINPIQNFNKKNYEKRNNSFFRKSFSFKKKNNNKSVCLTIDDFTKKFPNLRIYQSYDNVDIFKIQTNLEFKKKLDSYFEIIENTLKDKKRLDINKIYDYVMSKIYDKIYPMENHEDNINFYQQTIRLSWTNINHFIEDQKNIVFGNFLTDVLSFFKLIDTEKSPRKMIENVIKISDSIRFLIKYNKISNPFVDYTNILNYVLIKAQQYQMISNIKFMELYCDNKKTLEKNKLNEFLSSCVFITNINYSDLKNVTEEEYNLKCLEATNLGK